MEFTHQSRERSSAEGVRDAPQLTNEDDDDKDFKGNDDDEAEDNDIKDNDDDYNDDNDIKDNDDDDNKSCSEPSLLRRQH